MTPNKLVNQVLKEASSPLPTPQPGIDFEGEDRSVGIFGNAWIFTGTDDKTYVLFDDGELRRDSGGQDITVAKAPETNALFQQVVKMYDDEHGKKPKPKQVSSREEVDDAVNKILRPSESTVNLTQKLEDVSDKLRRQGISAVVEYPEVVDVTLKIEAEVEGVAFGFVNGPWLGYTAYDKAGGSIEGEGMSGEGDVSEESSADEMVEYIKSVVSKFQ